MQNRVLKMLFILKIDLNSRIGLTKMIEDEYFRSRVAFRKNLSLDELKKRSS